jgi:hypothetical protein
MSVKNRRSRRPRFKGPPLVRNAATRSPFCAEDGETRQVSPRGSAAADVGPDETLLHQYDEVLARQITERLSRADLPC